MFIVFKVSYLFWLFQRLGKYPPPSGKTSILGLEAAGIIHKTGSSITKWKVGDKVMALCNGKFLKKNSTDIS